MTRQSRTGLTRQSTYKCRQLQISPGNSPSHCAARYAALSAYLRGARRALGVEKVGDLVVNSTHGVVEQQLTRARHERREAGWLDRRAPFEGSSHEVIGHRIEPRPAVRER